MQVIEFIKKNGLNALTEQFAISVTQKDDLIMLKYNQIDSPKTHPIVQECRSLILESGTLKVVSRSFDRFYNYGEAQNVMPVIDWSKAVAYEKVDGSLIKIYNHKGHWYISTNGTIYAESGCMGFDVTFRDLVLKALGCENDRDFQIKCSSNLWHTFTYIFELTSFENRVVKRYNGTDLHFLACRANLTGNYIESEKEYALALGAKEIKSYRFGSVEDCIETAKHLKDLDEGYVVYQDGIPVAKVKSPAYVAVHHIRGEGLNPKRIMQLVLVNEQDEYITYFPDDAHAFEKYVNAKKELDIDMNDVYDSIKHIDDNKDFALKAKKYSFSAALFSARQKNISVIHAFDSQKDNYKMEILKGYIK